MEDLSGQTLGPYTLLNRIGMGGMASVYRAYQANMDRYVAIKVLPREFAEDPGFVGRFQQEARIIAKLEHRHILPVYDYGEDAGITYLVMRFVDGGTLKDLVRGVGIDPQDALRLVAQVADALDQAHRQGVVHRDVKPSNVLLDRDGDAYLTDFGIARLAESVSQFTGSGQLIGTPFYMSPEQCRGNPADPRSDIYSLGIMLYELVTGRLPFEAETPIAVVLMHIQDPLPPPPAPLMRVFQKPWNALSYKPPPKRRTTGFRLQATWPLRSGWYWRRRHQAVWQVCLLTGFRQRPESRCRPQPPSASRARRCPRGSA